MDSAAGGKRQTAQRRTRRKDQAARFMCGDQLRTKMAAFNEVPSRLGDFGLNNADSGLPPLKSTFIHAALPTLLSPKESDTCRRRRHSFCGAPSWYQQELYRRSAESDVSVGDPAFQRGSNLTEVGTADADSEACLRSAAQRRRLRLRTLQKTRKNEMLDDSLGGCNNEMFEDSPGGTKQMPKFGATAIPAHVQVTTKVCAGDASTCEDIDSNSNDAEKITLMIRNMPRYLNQSDVVSELHAYGFAGTYDWLYMPSLAVDAKRNSRGKGYAFVNFVKPEFARRFTEEWHGSRHWRMSRRSVLDISAATVQGKEKNIEQYMRGGKTSRILSSSFQPFEPEYNLFQTYAL